MKLKKYIFPAIVGVFFGILAIIAYCFSDNSLGATQAIHGNPAVYNATTPTLSDGDGAALNVDVNGNLLSNQSIYTYAASSTAGVTYIKTSAGYLHCITINTTGTIGLELYNANSTSTMSSATKMAGLKASIAEGTYCYDSYMSSGIIASTSSNIDFTVSYK